MKLKNNIARALLKRASLLMFHVLCMTILWCQHSIALEPIFVKDTGKYTYLVQFRDQITKKNQESQRQRKKEALDRLKSALQKQSKTDSNNDAVQTINQIQNNMRVGKSKATPKDDGPQVPDSRMRVERLADLRAQKKAEKEAGMTYSEENQVFMNETRQADILNLP